MMNITETVKQLIIINVIFFLGSLVVPAASTYLALWYFENPNFEYWQPLTHMFMHGGWMHIFFNMFALYSFGSALEHFWGGKKFLFFYISCGLGAALLHSGVNYYLYHEGLNTLVASGYPREQIIQVMAEGIYSPQWGDFMSKDTLNGFLQAYNAPAVGASGAIYGLLVAFAFMFPTAELALMFIPVPVKAKYFVPGLLLIDLYLGLSGRSIFGGPSGIAHFAHIGGAIVGFLMMWFWKKNQFNNNRWDRR
ncbi:rhomboid family intramembrane serine protease [Flavobacterium cerinum]|uniref:Rhomboid family intramembrane serine protease n=1 Tax=Flavobacterium cerinum TaxID=2502784 RepID=A0ABY5J070_9FLAO|nr:rhomboid family intramembrane serine protease [Flavobacterium cerinum]UUC47132.1 rhomboid family intramembrane serine protease [Flavobacterium cerinum]